MPVCGSRQRRHIASVPAGPVLMEFATMVGGRGEIKKDVDFPEAGEDTALCDKENKPPRIAQGSSNVFL